jgi:chromosome segregation ATPase
MSTVAMDMTAQGAESLAAADFQALEERVLRAVELLKTEREAHARASGRVQDLERRTAELEQQTADLERRSQDLERHGAEVERELASRTEESTKLAGEVSQLQQERDQVRGRVERLLRHLDEFTA